MEQTRLWVGDGGNDDGGPVLVLLHGLGHTAEVWQPLVEQIEQSPDQWPGQWVAPDLRGHGRSGWAQRYSFGSFAAEVAELLPADRPVVAVGHSMGGVVALALASGLFGLDVAAVVGFGIKVHWTAGDLTVLRGRAAKPSRTFDSEAEARATFVRFGGLTGLVAPDSPLVASGIRAVDGGYRLATDPRTGLVGEPPMRALLGVATAPVVLACGERDHLGSVDHLRELTEDAVELSGVGHNPHVEAPAKLLALIGHARSR